MPHSPRIDSPHIFVVHTEASFHNLHSHARLTLLCINLEIVDPARRLDVIVFLTASCALLEGATYRSCARAPHVRPRRFLVCVERTEQCTHFTSLSTRPMMQDA